MFKHIDLETFRARTGICHDDFARLRAKGEKIVSLREIVEVNCVQAMPKGYLYRLIRSVTLDGGPSVKPYGDCVIELVRMDPNSLLVGQTFVERVFEIVEFTFHMQAREFLCTEYLFQHESRCHGTAAVCLPVPFHTEPQQDKRVEPLSRTFVDRSRDPAFATEIVSKAFCVRRMYLFVRERGDHVRSMEGPVVTEPLSGSHVYDVIHMPTACVIAEHDVLLLHLLEFAKSSLEDRSVERFVP
ncbi:hypothetical protein ACFLZO_01380, partial [Patescibacteria group bacterium]